jgi:hypothetical protein
LTIPFNVADADPTPDAGSVATVGAVARLYCEMLWLFSFVT